MRPARTGLAGRQPPALLQLGDLTELELDGRLPSEDVDQDFELRTVDVDLRDRTVEVGERAGDDAHLLAFLELDPRPGLLLDHRPFGLHDAEDVLDLLAGERGGPRPARADEAGDTGRV